MPKAKVSEKAGAPAVVKIDRSGGRVRLRNIDHALDCCVSTEAGDIRAKIQPNVWTDVPEEIYQMLKGKFYEPEKEAVVVPNWDVGGDTDRARSANRTEHYEEYTLEFPDEARRS